MEQAEVKLVAAFKGLKFIPNPVSFGKNNINPKLILKKESIEYRNVFFTSEKAYEQIEEVDVYLNSFKLFGVTTTNICLKFTDTPFTFVGNLNDIERLKELVLYFKKRGIKLSEKAEAILLKKEGQLP